MDRVSQQIQGGLYGTALQAASCIGNPEIIKVLPANGADPNIQGASLVRPRSA
jgi:hypothetical protein